MPTISVLLPSLRPENVARRIAEFAATNNNVDYELVVVSPFEVSGDKVHHIQEKERKGVIHAMNEAYAATQGEYVVLWSDDAVPCEGCLSRIVDFVAKQPEHFVGVFRKKIQQGRESEQWSVYGKLTAGWLCAKRKTLEWAGGLFNPVYKNYWADPDLSLRVWEKGGSIGVCPDAWLIIDQEEDEVKETNLKNSFEADKNTFFDKWHDKFGKGKKRDWRRINCQVPLSFVGKVRGFFRALPWTIEIKDKLRAIPLDPFLALAFLTAPLFYVRAYGFDFSRGTSFSLVDCFLVFVLLKSLLVLWKRFENKKNEKVGFLLRIRQGLNKETWFFVLTGCFFCFWGLLSALAGRLIYDVPEPLSGPSLLSGLVQYGFVMIALPIIAAVFLITPLQRLWAIRLIALGYLLPLVMNLLLVPYDSPAVLRDLFFSVRRAIGTYGNANSFADVLLIVFPFYVYLSAQEKDKKWRRVGTFGLVLSLICLLLTGSFGGWLALIVLGLASLALLFLWKKHPARQDKTKSLRWARTIMVFSLLGFGGLFLYYPPVVKDVLWRVNPLCDFQEEKINAFLSFFEYRDMKVRERKIKAPGQDELMSKEKAAVDKMGSGRQRIEMITGALKLIQERDGGLFFGHGLRQTFALPQFHFFGHPLDVHMLYLLLWIEGGFVLMVTYVGFLFLLFRQAFYSVKNNPSLALALGSSVFSILLIGGINPHLYLRYFWVPLLPLFSLYWEEKGGKKA